jgi:hypothetical protein
MKLFLRAPRAAGAVAVACGLWALGLPAAAQSGLFAPVMPRDKDKPITILAEGTFSQNQLAADDPKRTAGFGEKGPRTSPNFPMAQVTVDPALGPVKVIVDYAGVLKPGQQPGDVRLSTMFECHSGGGCQIPGQVAGMNISAGVLRKRDAKLDGRSVELFTGRESHVYPLPAGKATPRFDVYESPNFAHVAVRVTVYQGEADPRGSGAGARSFSAIKLIIGGVILLGIFWWWAMRGRGSAAGV